MRGSISWTRAAALVLTLAIAGVPPLFLGSIFGWLPLLFLMVLLLLSLLYALLLSRRISCTVSGADCTCARGEETELHLRVENTGYLPCIR